MIKYSDKSNKINGQIDRITKNCIDIALEKILSKKFWAKDEDIDDLLKDYPDEVSRNYIQKYAETEMNDYSSRLGKFSYVVTLFALVYTVVTTLSPIHIFGIKINLEGTNDIFKYLFIFLLLILPVWLFKIAIQKNFLKTIIMNIEAEKLNKQKDEMKLTSETQVPDKDMKIKIDKFNLNLSISGER